MKPKALIPLVIGLGVGFFAIKMTVDMVRKAKGDQGGETKVLVAGENIEVATRITENMLSTKTMPAATVSGDSFTDMKALVGRVSKMTIPKGVAIGKGMLAPPGAEPGLRAKIPAGYRAVSVKVNEASAVSGFIMPGADVDVFALEETGGGRGRGQSVSRVILTDVQVGAVGQTLSEVAPDGKTVFKTKTVTLFLKPDQVAELHAASAKGEIRLALRGNGDEKEPAPTAWNTFLEMAREAAKAQPAPKPAVVVTAPPRPIIPQRHIVQVVRGTAIETMVFDHESGLMVGVPMGGATASPSADGSQPMAPAGMVDHQEEDPEPESENREAFE